MPHDPDLAPGLTPAEEQVRRLLADARHTEPMPDDVAARLDGVLADLASEDGAGPRRASDHSVVRAADLAAARRRRTVRHLLVAAAAVVAVGVGIDQADLTVTGDGADSSSADGAGAAPEPAAGSESQRDDAGTADRDQAESAEKPGKTELGSGVAGYQSRVVRLAADRFGAQVRRLQVDAKNMTMADQSASASQDFDGSLLSFGRVLSPSCSTRGWGAGLLVPVRYDGDLGGLVFREARGETQVVDLFLCGRDEPTRSITLPDR
ncbi:hypothetical protein [Nocardioides sp. T2.26MG-1]|uniref:hypothetical protein n=1 Tax=Nocardioides sp. T2.26MG-1 TaxID=3041166 RepID=UPI0024774F9C|nr:hypothetical protein [Nocardioides sp. T2.26MG-1]CAI9402733.1 hypothetical protein HIDPHFAB_00877 [Nocardioides sp. T2.26MG-1]